MEQILVIDTGSSSMRGLLFTPSGNISHTCQKAHFMQIDSDTAVQSADEFKQSLFEICRDMASYADENKLEISALSFTSQRSSVLPVDEDGTPLSDIMMWYDKRAQSICDRINKEDEDFIYRACGMKASPVFSAPKMAWIRRNRPEIYQKSFKLIGIHDYLLFLSTGSFVTDTSLASRTCLLDVSTAQWSPGLQELFEISPDKLCSLLPVGSMAGTVTKTFADITGLQSGIPVVSAGGDQQCSALGQMLTKNNQMGITSGTASYVAALSDKPIFDKEKRVNVNISAQADMWMLEGASMSSGAVYRWIRDTFYGRNVSYDEINREVMAVPPLCKGLLMLPDLAGKGCPQWDSYAKGSFHNIGFEHTRGYFARAAIEGICAEIEECFEVLCSCVGTPLFVTSTGGLSRVSVFNQILADMMQVPVEKCPVEETTGIGAWVNAALAIGLYPDIEAAFGQFSKASGECATPEAKAFAGYERQKKVRAYLR